MTMIIDGTNGLTFNDASTQTKAGLVVGTASPLVSGTAVASTSGTSIDFTSIPSWVKKITIVYAGVSTNGSSSPLIQIGPSSAVETTGYISTGIITGAGTATISSTAGFVLFGDDANDTNSGIATIVNISGNSWVYSQAGKITTNKGTFGGGDKTVASTLSRVRITTVSGTGTFDAGSINILYE